MVQGGSRIWVATDKEVLMVAKKSSVVLNWVLDQNS